MVSIKSLKIFVFLLVLPFFHVFAQPVKLGGAIQYSIGTKDMAKSMAFYEKLGFKKGMSLPSGTQMTDGCLLIMLQPSDEHYVRMTYFDKNAAKTVEALEAKKIVFSEKNVDKGMYKRSIFSSAIDGMTFSLISLDAGSVPHPDGKTIKDMTPEEIKDGSKYPNKKMGAFGEFSIPVKDLEKSIAWWEQLGYKTTGKYSSPYPWAILTDGVGVIGLHQQTDFTVPTLTYCAHDAPARIEVLKKEGITGKEFMGPGNVVLVAPEGTHIFLFTF